MFSNSRLVCFLLLWSLTIVLARTTIESPLKSSIVEAQETFLNAQGSIIKIHAGEVIAESLDELKSRLAILQTEIEKLILASSGRSDESESCISAMNNLTSSYAAIDSRLRGLQMEFEKHNVFESRTILFRDIIADIRSHRFLLADEKFIQLDDVAAVSKVVHEVYAHSEDNLMVVLNFSTAVSDPSRCFAVLTSLTEEISNDGLGTEALKLIHLAKAIAKKDFNCNSSDRTFSMQLVRQIQKGAVAILVTSMKSGNFSSNENVRLLLDVLYDYDISVFDLVMQGLIDGTYGIVARRVLLANIFLRCNTPQAISGIGHLFWTLKAGAGFLNDSDLIIDIASNLSELRNRIDFANLSIETKNSFDKVVGSIPQCARNLFFEQSVCLWNPTKRVYLQAVGDMYNYDKERRRVFTTTAVTSEVIPHGAPWIPMRQGDDILFRSRYFRDEFLYYANFEYNSGMRFIFAWIVGNNKDNQSAFKIQLLDDESCYLKSTRYNEYLLASDVKFEKDNSYSYVFAKKGGSGASGGLDAAFSWQVKAC